MNRPPRKQHLPVALAVWLSLAGWAGAGSVKPTAPAGSYTNSVNFNFASNVFRFFYTGADGSLEYEYAPVANGSFYPLRCKVNGAYVARPANYGGLTIASNSAEIFPWQGGVAFQLLNAYATNNDALYVKWRMTSGTSNLVYSYQFSIAGRTLTIQAATTNGGCGGLYLDRCEDTVNPVVIRVPYLAMMNVLYTAGVFTSLYFDWETTDASTIYPSDNIYSATSVYYAQQARYYARTDGTRNKVNETIYLTVSPTLNDVLPNVLNPVSPLKDIVSKYLVFDFWQTPFSFTRSNLLTLHNAGITNLWLIQHAWQNGGYDNKYPDVMPANAAWGGDAGLQSLSETAHTNGYLFSLHENYTDFYTNAASWNPAAAARESDGSLKKAWSNETTHMQSYGLKPSLAANYVAMFAPQIHSNYTTTASFLDVHSSVNPSDRVDYDAGVTNSAKFREVLNLYRGLGAQLRGYHQGPVSGEGHRHMLHVGYYDDVEAQINTGSFLPRTFGAWLPPFPDFELTRLHDRALTHGVGYYERFFADANENSVYASVPKDKVLTYIATELIYGHGGFIPTPDRTYDVVDVARLEQRHVLPAQKLYANAIPVSILYHDIGSNDLVSASDYIRRHPATFDNSTNASFMGHVRVTYDNGVVVCVNRHPTQSWAVQLGHPGGWFNYNAVMNGTNTLGVGVTNLTSYVLPPTNGWVMFAPDLTPPKIAAVTLTNGVLSLSITNLLPGCSNNVERSASLPTNNWQVVNTFVSVGTQTNFSQSLSGAITQVFYRVKRFW